VKIPSQETRVVEELVSSISRPGSDLRIDLSNIFKEFDAKAPNSNETLCKPSIEPEKGSVIVFNFSLPGIFIIR
jgi:hypothetical protein